MNRWFLFTAILILSFFNTSFRWPVNNGRITSTFAEFRSDHFHDGIDMKAADIKIYPIKAGKLIFFWDRSLFPLENYSGVGNYKIINHSNSVYSIYLHLEDSGPLKDSYTEGDVVGYMGNTGHSYGNHIHFSLLDSTRQVSINPLAVMPAMEDVKAPTIVALHLKIGDKHIQIRDKSKIRLTKHYPLLLELFDSIAGAERVGIYRLVVSVNSKKVLDLDCKQLKYSSSSITLMKKRFDEIFDEKGYYKVSGIHYQQGENKIFVTAYDYCGNKSDREFAVDVNLDMPEE